MLRHGSVAYISHKKVTNVSNVFCVVVHCAVNVLQRDDICTRVNCAQARLQLEQCECRAAEDWGGGTVMLWHSTEQPGQV